MSFFEFTFWAGLALLFFTFVGYPLLLWLLAFAHTSRHRSVFSFPLSNLRAPNFSATVVLCVHNEETRIVQRIQNLLHSDYPTDRLNIVVVSDGSSDQTVAGLSEFIKTCAGDRVELLVQPHRTGKAYGLNLAVAKATGEIVVFVDARQHFETATIHRLVARFIDSRVGAVSGALDIAGSCTNTGCGVDAYWRLEKFVRRHESALGTTIGCTGAVYAICRGLFRPLPQDTILDDVIIPMAILSQGHRVVFEPLAVAFDPQRLEPGRERTRKRRTLAGNYQMFFRYPGWLLPWRNRAWWQLVSHKYLRLLAPWLLLSILAANLALANQTFYLWTLAGQASLYLLASWGFCFARFNFRLLTLPAGFVFLNAMAVAGLFHYVRGGANGLWERDGGCVGGETQHGRHKAKLGSGEREPGRLEAA